MGDKMNTIILVIFVSFTLLMFISNSIEIKKYRISHISEKIRIDVYKNTLIFGMITLIIVGLLIIFTNINPKDILFISLSLDNNYLIIATYLTFIVMMLYSAYQILGYCFSPKMRSKSFNELNKNAKSDSNHESFLANVMIPRSFKEKIWFTLISLSAAISEEVMWRGLLIFLLDETFNSLPVIVIIVVASLLFGLGHSYQGVIGILKTSLVGLLLAGLFVVTGNLLLSIILHFILDFTNNFLYDKSLSI